MKNLIFLSLLCATMLANAQQYSADWESIDSRPVPEWFTDARFGIFIHWGLYSVPAWATVDNGLVYSEWYWWQKEGDNGVAGDATRKYHNEKYGPDFHYQDFVKDFKAEHFDPEAWAQLFEDSGAKYVVLTSKHHEGFALWPSAESWNWNSVDVGPHRDLCGDLSDAVKRHNLHMGFYYSLYEWYNPIYLTNPDRYVDQHMIPQLKDLVTRYEPDIVWTDGEWEKPSETWRSTEFLAWLYNESPVRERVVVNDRWGNECRGHHGGFYTTEYDMNASQADAMARNSHPWEECRGIGGSFGYNRAERLEHYASTRDLVVSLIERSSRGGNLLLDIGPEADGSIPLVMQERLLGIGRWLKTNGEAIYGTMPWEGARESKADGVFFTRRGQDLYVHIAKPVETVKINGLRNRPKAAALCGEKVSFSGNKLTISKELRREIAEMPQVIRLSNAF